MSLPINMACGILNIGYQGFLSVDLGKKTLVIDQNGHLVHRATPFALSKADKLSAGTTDGMVSLANTKTLAQGILTTAIHVASSFPNSLKQLPKPIPSEALNRTIKCNRFLGVAAILSTTVNLYLQKSLSYDAVMNNYMKNWEANTAEMKKNR